MFGALSDMIGQLMAQQEQSSLAANPLPSPEAPPLPPPLFPATASLAPSQEEKDAVRFSTRLSATQGRRTIANRNTLRLTDTFGLSSAGASRSPDADQGEIVLG